MSYIQNDKGQWQCENYPAPMCEKHGVSTRSKHCTCPIDMVGPVPPSVPVQLPPSVSNGLGIIEVSLINWDSADEFWRRRQMCSYRLVGLYRGYFN